MIETPQEKNPHKAEIRVIIEALAQCLPGTGALAHMFSYAHPTDLEKDIAAWQQKITNAVNDHEEKISSLESFLVPKLKISTGAVTLAVWLTQSSDDGLKTSISFSNIQQAFPDVPKELLEEHCSELKYLGLATISSALGHHITHIRCEYKLYCTFDAAVMGTNPIADAVHLAKLMLENKEFESINKLHKETGWTKRRLNPAVALLMPHIATGRTRQTIQSNYPTLGFSLESEDKFHLKNFISEFEGHDTGNGITSIYL